MTRRQPTCASGRRRRRSPTGCLRTRTCAARREGMGQVAGRLADRVVLTNEDPRDEAADAIIEAIAAGLRETGRREGRDFTRVPERRQAIARAFAGATAGDTVLLAGKATETTMIFGEQSVPWDERAG